MSSMSTNTSVTEGGGCSTFVSASRTSRSSASCQALACSRPVSRSNASPTATLIPATVDAGMLDLTQRSDIPPTRDLDLGEPAARAVVLAARRVKHQLGISERRFWLYHPGFGPLAQLVEQGKSPMDVFVSGTTSPDMNTPRQFSPKFSRTSPSFPKPGAAAQFGWGRITLFITRQEAGNRPPGGCACSARGARASGAPRRQK